MMAKQPSKQDLFSVYGWARCLSMQKYLIIIFLAEALLSLTQNAGPTAIEAFLHLINNCTRAHKCAAYKVATPVSSFQVISITTYAFVSPSDT